MKKHKPIQLSIPQPCSEDWNKMTPQEQGRFCDACQKCVVDFTGFNDNQLYNYLHKHKGEKVCGRFRNTQLNRTIHIPPQPHSRLYRIAIAVGLTLAIVSTAEVHSFAKAPLIEYSFLDKPQNDSTTNNTDSTIIKGRVVDEQGEPLPHAIIQIKNQQNKVIAGAATDYDGYYNIPIKCSSNIKLNIIYNYIGYETKENINVLVEPNKAITVNVIMDNKNINLPEIEVLEYEMTGLIYIDEKEITPHSAESIIEKPLINTLNPSPMNKTISGDEIDKMTH